jgi:predicted DNA-binding transcriptional regulator AlpA
MLDTRDVCRALKTSRAGLYRAIARGEVPQPKKLGRRNRWSAAALEKAIGKLPSETLDTSKAVEARKAKRSGTPSSPENPANVL